MTGAASGIGQATALAYARAGADVLLVDRDDKGLQETVRLKDASAGSFVTHSFDLIQSGEIAGVVTAAVEEFGKLDILNNTAGISIPRPFDAIDEEMFDRILTINLKSIFFLCQAAAQQMQTNGGGSIVNVASAAALIGIPTATAYSASKAGIVGLTRSLAVELATHGIRVNTICPGFVDTPMTRPSFNAIEDEHQRQTAMENLFSKFLIKRAAKPEELADAAVFLASDAATYITGVILPVDGGWSVW